MVQFGTNCAGNTTEAIVRGEQGNTCRGNRFNKHTFLSWRSVGLRKPSPGPFLQVYPWKCCLRTCSGYSTKRMKYISQVHQIQHATCSKDFAETIVA